MKPGDLVRVRMTARGPVERLGAVGRLVEILDRREIPYRVRFRSAGGEHILGYAEWELEIEPEGTSGT